MKLVIFFKGILVCVLHKSYLSVLKRAWAGNTQGKSIRLCTLKLTKLVKCYFLCLSMKRKASA